VRNLHVYFAVRRGNLKAFADALDARGEFDTDSRTWYVDSEGIRAAVMFEREARVTRQGVDWEVIHAVPIGASPPRRLPFVGRALYRRLDGVQGILGPWTPRELDALLGEHPDNPLRRNGDGPTVPWVIYGEDPVVSTNATLDDVEEQ